MFHAVTTAHLHILVTNVRKGMIIQEKLFMPCHTIVAGYYRIALAVCVSVHLSVVHLSAHPYFRFRTITLVNVHGFSPNLVCDIVEVWFGLLMGKFRQFLTELSSCNMSVFSFPDNYINGFLPNLVCALILWRSGLGLLMSKFCLFFYGVICSQYICVLLSRQ